MATTITCTGIFPQLHVLVSLPLHPASCKKGANEKLTSSGSHHFPTQSIKTSLSCPYQWPPHASLTTHSYTWHFTENSVAKASWILPNEQKTSYHEASLGI